MPKRQSTSLSYYAIFAFVCALVLEFIVLSETYPSSLEEKKSKQASSFEFGHPLVVLYSGGPQNEWQTGFWSSWANHQGNLQGKVVSNILPWAAEGTVISKTCDVPCYITRDQSILRLADVVVMEIINHKKTFGDAPMKWPRKTANQQWGMFYYEPPSFYSNFLTDDLLSHFDFTMTPHQDSDLPQTLICTWGKSASTYLNPPPKKDHGICDFSPNVPEKWKEYFGSLRNSLNIDTFYGVFANKNEGSFNLPKRMRQISSYKFVIIIDYAIERDWVGPEFSQAFLSGTVPIYLGATNIDDFVPGPNSFINVANYTADELVSLLQHLLSDEEEYLKYFEWKKNGLSSSFQQHLENCVHYSECRMCHYALEHGNIKNQRN